MKFNLIESKQDWINFENKFGTELNDKFKSMRKRFQSPENDIYYWMNKPVKDLEDFLDNAEQGNFSMSEVRKGSKLVYSDSTSKIYEIANFPASHYYGKATGWCISGRYSGHWNKSATHWNQHMEQGIRFYFYFDLTKQNTMTYTNDKTGKTVTETDYNKYAFSIYKNGSYAIHSHEDNPVNIIKLPPTFPDVREVPELHKIYQEIRKYDHIDFDNYIYDGEEIPNEIKDKITGIIVKDGVTEIGNNSISYCESLTSITIPNSVKEIRKSAFAGCTSLTSIAIPNSVKEIGNFAFYKCTSLTSINVPNSVATIGDSVFYGCTSLISINVPNSVATIGDSVFASCKSLISITIPNSVTTIGHRAFTRCTSLISIAIPTSVTSIGDDAFYGCNSLTSINIPNSVTKIGIKVFVGCLNLTIYTNNPVAIEYAKQHYIHVKPLQESLSRKLRFRLVENIYIYTI